MASFQLKVWQWKPLTAVGIKGEKVDPFVLIPYELITPDNYKSYRNR